MIVEHRNYKGTFFHPQPIIFNDDKNLLTIIAIPWGPSEIIEDAIATLSNYYLSSLDDVEATTPFARLPGLSDTLNHLRVATLLANAQIYQHNSEEILSSMEVLAISQIDQEISWVKVGGPNIFLVRGQRTIPISVTFNLEQEFTGQLAPLPKDLIGLENHCNMTLNNFSLEKGDRFTFITKNDLYTDFYSSQDFDLQKISQRISKKSPEQPFWLGLYQPN